MFYVRVCELLREPDLGVQLIKFHGTADFCWISISSSPNGTRTQIGSQVPPSIQNLEFAT